MAVSKGEISRCGLCRFYTHEGRRGGVCERLSAPVAASWTACELAASPFDRAAQKRAAIAAKPKCWQVPETVSALVAHPTVVNSANRDRD